MKIIKFAAIQLLILFIVASCNNNRTKQKETKDTTSIASIDSSKKPAVDPSKKNELSITAMFVEFSLGDASHYIFKDKVGKIWDFADCKDKKFLFGVELQASKANSENQGWTSNKTLQGKWFELTYKYVTQPEYQDGPITKVPIITKALLK